MSIIPEQIPIKRIKLPQDVQFWESTIAYHVLFQTLHLLNDMLSMKGCIFNCKMTTGNHGVVKDTIVSLKFGDWTLTKDQISLFGKQINEFLIDLIKQEKGTVTLKRDQNVLVNYFNKIISQSE